VVGPIGDLFEILGKRSRLRWRLAGLLRINRRAPAQGTIQIGKAGTASRPSSTQVVNQRTPALPEPAESAEKRRTGIRHDDALRPRLTKASADGLDGAVSAGGDEHFLTRIGRPGRWNSQQLDFATAPRSSSQPPTGGQPRRSAGTCSCRRGPGRKGGESGVRSTTLRAVSLQGFAGAGQIVQGRGQQAIAEVVEEAVPPSKRRRTPGSHWARPSRTANRVSNRG